MGGPTFRSIWTEHMGIHGLVNVKGEETQNWVGRKVGVDLQQVEMNMVKIHCMEFSKN